MHPRTKRVTDLVAPIHADPEPRVRVEKEKLEILVHIRRVPGYRLSETARRPGMG